MYSEQEVEKILSNYLLGKLEDLGQILKNDHASFGQEIITSKGRYFLKSYRMFNYTTEQGLNLLEKLNKSYPTNGLILSKDKKAFIEFNKNNISIFEFIDLKEKLTLNKEEVKELAKYLGKLHKLTLDCEYKKGRFDWNYFNKFLNSHLEQKDSSTKEIKELVEYMYENFKFTKARQMQPKAANHLEFTPEHVRLKNNVLLHVLDWDEIGLDYCFYDIGTSLISCFNKENILDYKKVGMFLESYNNERRLTDWEKEHIFEALQYGCFKFCIWNLTDAKTNNLKSSYDWPEDIERVKYLMTINKKEFIENITKYFK